MSPALKFEFSSEAGDMYLNSGISKFDSFLNNASWNIYLILWINLILWFESEIIKKNHYIQLCKPSQNCLSAMFIESLCQLRRCKEWLVPTKRSGASNIWRRTRRSFANVGQSVCPNLRCYKSSVRSSQRIKSSTVIRTIQWTLFK